MFLKHGLRSKYLIMRKLSLIFVTLLGVNSLFAQQGDVVTEVIYATDFRITKPLYELAKEQPEFKLTGEIKRKEAIDKQFRRAYHAKSNVTAFPQGEDPALQKQNGTRQANGIETNWEGLSGSSYPPDPTGAAGINHYVQAVNSSYRVYSKTGTPLTAEIQLSSLLFNSSEGDPIVLYDKYADRWVVTEFKTQGRRALIAVSKTNDPTGQYYTWQFSSPQFPDYPKYSIWTDAYYMTSNQTTQKVFAFERDSLLAGVAAARAINKTFTPSNNGGFFCPLSADADGQLPPAGTPCPIFSYEDDGWGTGHVDRINIYNMTVTWGATPAATITLVAQLPTQSFDASYNSSWNDISQPGTTNMLDGIGGVFTFRAQYRRWTGYNTVVLNKGVKVNSGGTQRSIRWYELRQSTTTNQWSIYQQGTYAPDNLNRWCGSIAMDDNGSISLAYAVSGETNVYPGIRYTGRAASDPLNQMTFAEVTVASGNSSQEGINRWGDYSHTSLDPVDGTLFWHTGEYIVNGNPATRIFSFRLPVNTSSIEKANSETDIKAVYRNGKIEISANKLPDVQTLQLDVFDVSGRLIITNQVVPVDMQVQTAISVSNLLKGTYLIRLGCENTFYQKVVKIVIP